MFLVNAVAAGRLHATLGGHRSAQHKDVRGILAGKPPAKKAK